MGIHRSAAARKRRAEASQTRKVNKARKVPERARRDARMMARVKSGSLPYTPEVMSWLSAKLGKKASGITADDIAKLTA
jgi:hypothetical protein